MQKLNSALLEKVGSLTESKITYSDVTATQIHMLANQRKELANFNYYFFNSRKFANIFKLHNNKGYHIS